MELRYDRPATPGALRELLWLAGPTIGQMASYTVMQFIDTWMLARVGTLEATAASNAGGFAFSVISFGFGVLWVINTLVSQKFGENQHRQTGRYLWQGIWWALAYSLLLLPLLPLVGGIFRVLGHDARLVALEATYLRIVLAGSVFKLLATALGQFLLGVDRPNAVLVSAATGVLANAAIAWLLVLRWHTGVWGSAWAQNFGVFVEMLVVAAFVFRPAIRSRFNAFDWRLRWREMKLLLRVGMPSGVQVVTEVLAWMLFAAWVLAHFGNDAMAANTFMMRYMTVGFMPCFGISAAVTALVGRYIGMGQLALAQKRAHLGFVVAAIYMVACGLVYYFARYPLMHVFTHEKDVVEMGAVLLTFAAIYEVFDAMYIIYNGALRGAGDTFWPAVTTGVLCWGICVMGGYAFARTWPRLGPGGPWGVATVYGIILGIYMLTRFLRGRWKEIRLDGDNLASQAAA